jgi:hypothetical protein
MSKENADAPPSGYDVIIRRASDGVERTYHMSGCEMPTARDDFWWSEGNGACDCNRGDFFERAGGNDDSDESCGDSRYLVVAFIGSDGARVDGPDA